MSKVALEIDGQKLSGWKSVNITRELGSFCGSFELSFLDSWSAVSESWFVRPFSKCQVLIDDEVVLTGYVDRMDVSEGSGGRSIMAMGRDVTSDLVDCSAVLDSYEYKEKTISQLAKILLAKFKIEYVEEASPGKSFSLIQINQGTRVSAVLEEYAKYRGLFFLTDRFGRLVLASPATGASQTDLVSGQNILEYSITYSMQDRFSEYHIESQTTGIDSFFGTIANQVQQKAYDADVPRYRPYSTLADKSATSEDSKALAEWEATVRAAKNISLTVSVVGWRQGPGLSFPLWEVNAKVFVKIPLIGLNGEFLISSVKFSLDDNGGEVTSLGIERIDAYTSAPTIEPKTDPFIFFSGDQEI